MTIPSRAIWLPAVAVLLPCAFIGVVGYKWLVLERQTSASRSEAAAGVAVTAMKRGLSAELEPAATAVIAHVANHGKTSPPFEDPVRTSPLVRNWFVFDASGTLIGPDPAAAIRAAIDEYAAGITEPDWQRARDRVDPPGTDIPALPAQSDVDVLIAASVTPAQKAAAHLTIARAFAGAGQAARADRHAREIAACCPSTRDTFGISIPLMAAWLRAGLSGMPRDTANTGTALARELHDLAARGYLGHAEDLVTIGLIADRAGQPGAFTSVIAEIEQTRSAFDALRATATVAGRLAATSAPPDPSDLALQVVQTADARLIAARLPAPDGRQIVLTLDDAQFGEWATAWSAANSAFDIAVLPGGATTWASVGGSATGTFHVPLVANATVATLAVTHRRSSAASDQWRQILFVTAVVAAVVLALAFGLLAVRDVSRELRLASLRSTFVAGVTHELKTPLASIRLIAETLRQNRARPESRDRLLDTIVDESDRLTRLVDNVLSSSRIENGTRQYASTVVPIAGVVQQALERFDSVLKRDGFKVLASIDDTDIPVLADPDALGQSVINLLGNAAKYSGTSREIRVTVGRRNGNAEISVADDGIGIGPAEQARVFDSFYRASNAASDTTGAGLGLALVRHFAEAHGGRVSVSSTPGKGSVFTLRLPIQPASN